MNFDARENQAAPCYSAPGPVVIAIESTECSMDEKWKTQYCAFGFTKRKENGATSDSDSSSDEKSSQKGCFLGL